MRVSGRVGGTTGSRGGGRGARLGREGDFRWRVYLWRSGTCRLSELKGALWGSLVCAAEQKPRGRGASGASKALSSGDSESGLGGGGYVYPAGTGEPGDLPPGDPLGAGSNGSHGTGYGATLQPNLGHVPLGVPEPIVGTQ